MTDIAHDLLQAAADTTYRKGAYPGTSVAVDDQGNGLPTVAYDPSTGAAVSYAQAVTATGSPFSRAQAAGTGAVFDIDVTGYSTATVYVSGTFSATATFKGVYDGTNYVTLRSAAIGSASAPVNNGTGVSSGVAYYIPLDNAKKLKLDATVFASGTIVADVVLGNQPMGELVQAVVGLAAHDAAISGNPNRIAGRALTPGTPYAAVSAGDTADLVTDLTGAFLVAPQYTPRHLAANASTDAIKSGAGILHAATINTKGATGNVLTIFDSLTAGAGTTLAVIDTTTGPSFFLYDLVFTVGLSASIATGTAADVTLTYR